MFPTFSGSSRRPRQVNLSGQITNPFAANGWGPPTSASGTQKTIQNAQQERQLRHQERERLIASKKIQRTWRGHKTRRELADSRRRTWDDAEIRPRDSSRLVEQAKLLVAFFSSRRQDDLGRLANLSQRIYNAGYESFLRAPDARPLITRLAGITLDALKV
jgi:ubiquitin-protein ligase E3 C